jgi:SAM-dependent methyltransferase
VADTFSPGVDVKRLMRRIRQEAERRQGKYSVIEPSDTAVFSSNLSLEELLKLLKGQRSEPTSLTPIRVTLPQLPDITPANHFFSQDESQIDLRKLASLDDLEFVSAAYLSILKRQVDEDGLNCYRNMLREGATKLHIIGALLNSSEGKRRKAGLAGVRLPLLLDSMSRWPVVGRLLRTLVALWKLPDADLRYRRLKGELAFNRTLSDQRIAQMTSAIKEAVETLESSQNAIVGQAQLFTTRNHTNVVQHAAVVALETIRSLDAVVQNLDAVLQNLDAVVKTKSSHEDLRRNRGELENAVKGDIDSVRGALGDELAKLSKDLSGQQSQQARISSNLAAMNSAIDSVGKNATAMLNAAVVGIDSNLQAVKQSQLDHAGRISSLSAEVDSISPFSGTNHQLDSLYAGVENQFRGARDDIRNRQAIYLPLVREVGAGTEEAPVIDLGSGRGEWLELLRDSGLVAKGVDINRVFLASCRDIGLDVTESDILSYLRNLKTGSVGMLTSFHVIEHMPHKLFVAFIDEALRALKPGGLLILETPNPKNLVVAGCNFYLDPTHLNPIPYELSRYLLEARGFSRVDVLELHPALGEIQAQDGTHAVTSALNRLLYSAQDYALIGRKSA